MSQKFTSTKKLHTNVSSNFIHNHHNLEAIKISFSRLVDKYTVMRPENGILFSDKQKWAIKPSNEKTWKNFKCILLCTISTIWHSGKDKTHGSKKKILVIIRGLCRVRNEWQAEYRDFQGWETILYDIVMMDTCIIYLSKPTEGTTQSEP